MRNFFYYDKIDSTMSEYQKLKSLSNNLVAVRAGTQKDGIGRGDHVWISPPGGLWFTFDIESNESIPSFALFAGYCLHHCLEKLFQPLKGNLRIKWTNDIILNDRKLGGILCRYHQAKQTYVIGVGLNTNNAIDADLGKFGAISLAEVLGFQVSNNELCHLLVKGVEENCWKLSDEIAYLTYCNDNLFGKGKIAIIETGGLRFPAEIIGIDRSGALLVRKEMGELISIHSGSIIEFLA